MIVVIYQTTKEVVSLADFLKRHKGTINASSIEVTPELVIELDADARLFTLEERPPINESFELVEISAPFLVNGELIVVWEIKRLGRSHINDYYNEGVENHLDGIAKERGWKNQDRLLGNIDSGNENFKQEARYMRQLVDRTWEKALPIINAEVDDLLADPAKRPLPLNKLLEQLPPWKMPEGF